MLYLCYGGTTLLCEVYTFSGAKLQNNLQFAKFLSLLPQFFSLAYSCLLLHRVEQYAGHLPPPDPPDEEPEERSSLLTDFAVWRTLVLSEPMRYLMPKRMFHCG